MAISTVAKIWGVCFDRFESDAVVLSGLTTRLLAAFNQKSLSLRKTLSVASKLDHFSNMHPIEVWIFVVIIGLSTCNGFRLASSTARPNTASKPINGRSRSSADMAIHVIIRLSAIIAITASTIFTKAHLAFRDVTCSAANCVPVFPRLPRCATRLPQLLRQHARRA